MKKLLVLLLIGGAAYGLFFSYNFYIGSLNFAKDPDSDTRVILQVKSGTNADQIADMLIEKGLIRSKTAFNFYLKQNDLGQSLKAGSIVLQENFTMKEIVEGLVNGKTAEITITLLEGWTAKEMAEKLAHEGLTTVDDFMDCIDNCEFFFDFLPEGYLEGYLYPDTYFVDPAFYSDGAFIKRLIDTLESRITDDDLERLERDGRTLEEIMIIASIIEREERDSAERPTIAGILWSRFDNDIGLGADATVLYALGRTKGGLTYADLEVDSPYNTRKWRGLPPTPISNPSISSIRAAIYPHDSDYMYYLHDADGEVHYGVTLDEHNANKANYL